MPSPQLEWKRGGVLTLSVVWNGILKLSILVPLHFGKLRKGHEEMEVQR
jgi:hypothetical protein